MTLPSMRRVLTPGVGDDDVVIGESEITRGEGIRQRRRKNGDGSIDGPTVVLSIPTNSLARHGTASCNL